MHMQSEESKSTFSAVVFAMCRIEHGLFQIELIPPELVSKLLAEIRVAWVAGDRWNRSRVV